MSEKKKFYITTPIYYVNDKPHVGHAYTTIVADVLARWMRGVMNEDSVYFLTGTDEHGTKIAEAAEEKGKTPQEFCDEISDQFKTSWQKLKISNDRFIRTTDSDHESRVKQIFNQLKEARTPAGRDVIYLGEYKGLYCTGCEKFLTDKELVNGQCPHHKKAPEEIVEKNYFFRLSDYKDLIRQKIQDNEIKIFPESRKNEAISTLEFMDDFSVSRESVTWGIELPFDKTQKSYVWVDALSNYLTAIGYPNNEDYKNMWPADVQLMAQDILKFHAIYWPAILLALGLPLPKELAIHGFFTVDGQKMSKSLGNVIDPNYLVEKYGVDPTRYLIMSQFSFGQEADIQVEKFDEKYNADLANGLGNLVARTSNLLEKNDIATSLTLGSDHELVTKVNEYMSNYKFNEALKVIWDKIREDDEYLSSNKPWKLEDKEEIGRILTKVAEDILNIAACLEPFMPETSAKIVDQFSASQIKKGEPLFPRIISKEI